MLALSTVVFYSAKIYRNVVVGIVGIKALELREYVKVEHWVKCCGPCKSRKWSPNKQQRSSSPAAPKHTHTHTWQRWPVFRWRSYVKTFCCVACVRLAAEAAPTEKTGHTLEYKNQSLPSNHTFHHCSLSKHTHTHSQCYSWALSEWGDSDWIYWIFRRFKYLLLGFTGCLCF